MPIIEGMFSIEYLICFSIIFIGISIWMWRSDFKISKPKKGDEWIVITYIKSIWKKL